jgi:hypothetical protein
MARLHADENFDHRVVKELRLLGHDVLTAHEAGRANQGIGNGDVLSFAVSDNRAVLTFNRADFIRLHKKTQPHSGIVVCTNDSDVPGLTGRIHQALAACPILDNQLIRIIRPGKP